MSEGIDVKNVVYPVELNGSEAESTNAEEFVVMSHDANNKFVVLSYGCTKITVHGSDLLKAVKNSMRS